MCSKLKTGLAIDYGSSRTKLFHFRLGKGLSFGKPAGCILGHNEQDVMSSVVRIKKGSWLQGAATRLQHAKLDPQQQQRQHFRHPEYRIGDARSTDYITIRYSKRDIGRQLQDVDVRTASQEYGGVHLAADDQGFMAFQLDGRRVAHGYSITPLDLFEHFILQHIFKLADAKNKYTLMHLVLTVPVSATEDVKAQYEAAAKRALQNFPGLLPDSGAMPEVHIVAEPVAGMCDHFTTAEGEDEDADEQSQQGQQQQRVYLGIDVGDGTTDCCLVKYQPCAEASSSARVLGAHGNSYLGAVDVKHAVLSRLPEEVLGRVPEQCVEQLMRAVDRASEELSSAGAAGDVWSDWESITDALDSRQWLQDNVVITRAMVHATAAGFAQAFKQSIHTTLAVAKLQASEVTHVVAMGGGSELPCVQQAIKDVFGSSVSVTKGQGGGSTQIAQGAAAYVLQLLEQRRRQQGQQADHCQPQLQLGPVSMPVSMHVCTKVSFRGHCLHPKEQHPDYPISVDYLQQLKRCLATDDLEEKEEQAQLLDTVAAHYAHLEDASKPPAKMLFKKQLNDFEVFLPLIDCRAATPTAPAAITFMPPSSKQRSYSISLYAADPLFTSFTYIGGRQVQAPAALDAAASGNTSTSSQQQKRPAGGQAAAALHVQGEVWVDDRQRVQCRARLQSGQELPVVAVFDRDAVQRGRRQDRLSGLSSAAVLLLRQLNYGGATAAQLTEEAAARRQQEMAAAAAAAMRQQVEAAAAAIVAANAAAVAATATAAAAAVKQRQDEKKAAAAAAAARKQQETIAAAAAATTEQREAKTAAAAAAFRQQQQADNAEAAAAAAVAAAAAAKEKDAAGKVNATAAAGAAAKERDEAEKAAAAAKQAVAAPAIAVQEQRDAEAAAAMHLAVAAAAATAALAATPPATAPATGVAVPKAAAGSFADAVPVFSCDLVQELQQLFAPATSRSAPSAKAAPPVAAAAPPPPPPAAAAAAAAHVARLAPGRFMVQPSARLPGMSGHGQQSRVRLPAQLQQLFQHKKRKQSAPQHLPPAKQRQQPQLPRLADRRLPPPPKQQQQVTQLPEQLPLRLSLGLPQVQQRTGQQVHHVSPSMQQLQASVQPSKGANKALFATGALPYAGFDASCAVGVVRNAASTRTSSRASTPDRQPVGKAAGLTADAAPSSCMPSSQRASGAVAIGKAAANGPAAAVLGSSMQHGSAQLSPQLQRRGTSSAVGGTAPAVLAMGSTRMLQHASRSTRSDPTVLAAGSMLRSAARKSVPQQAAASSAAAAQGRCITRGRKQQLGKAAAATTPVDVVSIAESSEEEEEVDDGSCKRTTRSQSAATGVKRTSAVLLNGAGGGAAQPAGKKRAAAAALAPGCWILERLAPLRRSSRASDRTEHEIELLMHRGAVDDLSSDDEPV